MAMVTVTIHNECRSIALEALHQNAAMKGTTRRPIRNIPGRRMSIGIWASSCNIRSHATLLSTSLG